MTRLVFINRFYWPETPATGQLLTDLAEGLAHCGWPVTVITGRGGKNAAQELRHGVEIVRVRGAEQCNSTWSKLAAFVRFGFGATLAVLRGLRRNDVVVCLTDPPLLGVAIAFVARLRGAHVVHWAHDIYPEVAVAVSGHRWLQALRPLRNLAWRSADRVVTLGPRMGALVEAGGVHPTRVCLIPNWAPTGLHPLGSTTPAVATLRAEWGLTGRLVIGYSGNLGRVHDLEPILDLAGELRPQSDLAFVFIGGGAQRQLLQRRVADLGLTNVRFVPAQPREDLAAALCAVDVHLVTLKRGCEAVVYPSKLYGIAAVGRPVVFLGPAESDIADTIRTYGLGLVLDGRDAPNSATLLASFVRDDTQRSLVGRSALAFSASASFDTRLSSWNHVLREVSSPHGVRSESP